MTTRRDFLKVVTVAGAGLVVGTYLPWRGAHEVYAADGSFEPNAWLRVAPDGIVTIVVAKSEMGQGARTALPMLVAEDLEADWTRVRIEPAPLDKRYGQQGTGGSMSVRLGWRNLRSAGAAAREMLVGAAAATWKVKPSECRAENGTVHHPASGRKLGYGELAPEAAKQPLPRDPALKAKSEFKLLGRGLHRLDTPEKLDGRAVYGIDVRRPGMRFAALARCPVFGGKAVSFDATLAKAVPGVRDVVRAGDAVAVVADTTWAAFKGREALSVTWDEGPNAELSSAGIRATLLDLAGQPGAAWKPKGDVAAALAGGAKKVEAVYEMPYLAHATMEPMNGTAMLQDGRLTLWLPTQVPSQARKLAAKAAGVDEAHVALHVTLLGGGFGRRLEADYVLQVVEAAKAMPGRPVQILWSREEDTTHDFYRPASAAHLRASWGADWGKAGARPQSLRVHSAGDAITPRWMARTLPALAGPMDMPDKTAMEGLFDQPYAIAHQHMRHAATRNEVPVGFWRSVGHSHHAFFIESFIDEMAAESKADPVAFRLSLLADDMPRHAAVLRLAADKAGWSTPLASGHARGVALHESFGSIVAQVAEVALENGAPRVYRVVVAIDCGTVVNPGIVAQQMESAVIFGLTAALHGRIDIQGGMVQQKNFPDYPLLNLAQSPSIETHIIPSSLPPTGVGEPGTPPIAPAVANALFALTGKRLRALPLRLG